MMGGVREKDLKEMSVKAGNKQAEEGARAVAEEASESEAEDQTKKRRRKEVDRGGCEREKE